jgi:hypothetical protein
LDRLELTSEGVVDFITTGEADFITTGEADFITAGEDVDFAIAPGTDLSDFVAITFDFLAMDVETFVTFPIVLVAVLEIVEPIAIYYLL